MERFHVRNISSKDIPFLIPIIQTWVKDTQTGEIIDSEVDEIVDRLKQSLKSDVYNYYVVLNTDEKPVGMVGFRKPESKLIPYLPFPNESLEGVNIFLLPDYRGMGLGKMLIEYLKSEIKKNGYRYLVWSSGPRYEKTAWGMYDSYVGKAICDAPNFFGKNITAKIWSVPV